MSDADSIDLPAWARVTEKRKAHIASVTALLARWARTTRVSEEECASWREAGRCHDALRDASEDELRALVARSDLPAAMLHGPASATRLEADGERRADVLEAIRWHTVGHAGWARTGRALYMADYLEPLRPFARRERAFLAAVVPSDFDGVFRQVVRHRLEWSLREGNRLYPETVALWNQIC